MKSLRQNSYLAFLFLALLSACSNPNGSNDSNSTVNSDDLQTGNGPASVKNIQGTAKLMDGSSSLWQVTLTWDTTADIDYTIKRGTTTKTYTDTYEKIKSPYVIKNLEAGSTQYFIVLASKIVNNTTAIATSEEYSIAIPLDNYKKKPGPFTMSAIAGDGQVNISWTQPTDDPASFFVVQSGTSSGVYPKVVSKLATSPYIDKNLTNGATRYYIVIAVNSAGSTAASAEVAATPLAAPGTFGNVTAVPGDQTATLSWGTATGADHYSIQRSTNSNGPFETIKDNQSASPFIDHDLTNNTTYYYIVSAVNTNGTMTPAEKVSVVPMALPANFVVTAQAGNGNVQLTWPSSPGLSYTVQYGTSDGVYPQTVSNSAISPFTVNNLTNETLYYFQVIATNASGSTSSRTSAQPSSSLSNPTHAKRLGSTLNSLQTDTGARAMAADSSGNIFVAGYTTGETDDQKLNPVLVDGQPEAFIAKYDPSGTKLWARSFGYDPTVYSMPITGATDIASDGTNAFVVGSTTVNLPGAGLIGSKDAFLAKYSSEGSMLWTKQIGSPNLYTYGQGVGVDSQGNIIVTGFTTNSTNLFAGSFDHSFIIKYDTAGNQLWSTNISIGFSLSVAVNPSDDVFVTGSNIDLVPLPFVAKYNGADGSNIFSHTIFDQGTGTVPMRIISDTAGNIFVGGSTANLFSQYTDSNNPPPFFFVAKLDASGNAIWANQDGNSCFDFIRIGYQYWGYSFTPIAFGLASDGTHVYAHGHTRAAMPGQSLIGLQDYFIARYDYDGTNAQFLQDGVDKREMLGSSIIAVGSNIYISGESTANLYDQDKTGFTDLYISKYDSSLTRQWTRLHGAYVKGTVNASQVKTDSQGNVFIVGQTTGRKGDPTGGLDGSAMQGAIDYFIQKYDGSGTRLWTKQVDPGFLADQTFTPSFVLDETSQNLFLVGVSSGHVQNFNIADQGLYLAKFNMNDGTQVWGRNYKASNTTLTNKEIAYANNKIFVLGVVKDSDGNFYGPPIGSQEDGFISRFDPVNGDLDWVKKFGNSNSSATAVGMQLDGAGGIFIAGSTTAGLDGQSQSGSTDLFISKYQDGPSAPTLVWTKQVGAIGKDAQASAFTRDSNSGDLFITGNTQSGFDNPPLGFGDGFISKHSSNDGERIWVQQFGIANAMYAPTGISVNSTGKIFLIGYGYDYDGSSGLYSGYIKKFDETGSILWSSILNSTPLVFPTTIILTQPSSLDVNSSNRIYVIGSIYGNGSAFLDNTIAPIGEHDSFFMYFDDEGHKQ